jgi:cell wall-associated NlpC family hydrolase
MTTSESIVASARKLLGTPYRHQGRAPGAGVDCIGVAILVGRQLGLCGPDFDINGYGQEPLNGLLCTLLDAHLTRVDSPGAGDLLIFRWFDEPQHCGILTDSDTLIHAYSSIGRCVEHRYDEKWQKRFVCAYDLTGFCHGPK